MYLIGLTGNIATGKTTVCRMLARLGARIIDADALVHRVMQRGHPVFEQVVATFGPTILTPAGEIDRAHLGRIVFADRDALRRLEAIVHPAVRELIQQELAAATEDVVVLDAIKLIESGMYRMCDAVWVVTATQEQQLERLVTQRGMSRRDARQRMRAQSPQEEKVRRADVVIDNSGTEAETEAQVRRAWAAIARTQGDAHDD